MNSSTVSPLIASQQQTIARWQQTTQRDALDIASEISRRFRLTTRVEFDGFIWDIADMYAKQAAYFLSELFSEELKRHLDGTIDQLKEEISSFVGDGALGIDNTKSQIEQRALSLAVDDSPFKKALSSAKPSVLAHIFAPSMMSDNREDWDRQQKDRACDAVSAVVEDRVPELSNAIAKFLDAALNEYRHGLAGINDVKLIAASLID